MLLVLAIATVALVFLLVKAPPAARRGSLVGATTVAAVAFFGTGMLCVFQPINLGPCAVPWVLVAGMTAVPGAVVGLVGGMCVGYFAGEMTQANRQVPLD
jgi:hypothetical protein